MNFELSETQSILKDSVERCVTENYSLDKRQSIARSELGFSQDNWKKMAELGWLSITVPESAGGFGGNQIDSMISKRFMSYSAWLIKPWSSSSFNSPIRSFAHLTLPCTVLAPPLALDATEDT